MSFSFHPEAEQEFNKAIDYYENIEPGLGYDFALEVHSTIKRSVEFPKAWAVLEGDVRRSLVRRFPFGILYSEEKDGIFIVAVMNLHRKPGYWKKRKLEKAEQGAQLGRS
jgi:hypothetical protein